MFNKSGGGGLLGKSAQAVYSEDPIISRIEHLKNAYDEKSVDFRFKADFFNSKGEGKTGTLGGTKASQPHPNNPDPEHLVHEEIKGFDGLEARVHTQKDMIEVFKKKLRHLRGKIEKVKEYGCVLNDRLQEINENNQKIQLTLISVLKNTEVKALANFPLSSEEQVLLGNLQKQEEEIEKPNQFRAQLNTLELKAKQKKDSMETPLRLDVEPEVIKKAHEVLKIDQEAIESMIKITKDIELAFLNDGNGEYFDYDNKDGDVSQDFQYDRNGLQEDEKDH